MSQLMDECFCLPQFQNESSCGTKFDLHENEPERVRNMNGFALRLV